MKKFKVGDKVRVKKFAEIPWSWSKNMVHLMGKVVEVKGFTYWGAIICYDEVHKTNWAIGSDEIEPVDETIVIFRKDQEVIALDKSTGKRAIAKCSPNDEFDFRTGANLAFDRLMGKIPGPATPTKQEPTPYNGKLCCVKTLYPNWTFGKIYEVKDGHIADDKDATWPSANIFMSFEDVKNYFTRPGTGLREVEFVEVVE